MIARMNRVDVDGPKEPSENPSTIYVNLNKEDVPESDLKLGKKLKFFVEAKVTAVRKDEYGSSMNLEIVSMKLNSKEA